MKGIILFVVIVFICISTAGAGLLVDAKENLSPKIQQLQEIENY